MTTSRRIAVATFGRSDFAILRPLCRLLAANAAYDTGLWVGGAHFEEVSGRTVTEIEESGIPIWARIDAERQDRTELGTARTMSAQLSGFAEAASTNPAPDLVMILGDRFEAVSAGLAMVPLGIPVGHISGGSITEGAIDDVFRHCLTKIAAVHFCDLPRFARRIHFMGAPTDRIFTTGALGLDAFAQTPTRSFDDFTNNFGFDGLEPGFALATLHPESRHPDLTAPMAEALVGALQDSGRQVVYTYPNADPGADQIIDAIEAATDQADAYRVRAFGADWYPTAMDHAGFMIGNSSGGIIEAASFDLPVIDIGDRQKGREHGPNLLHCGRDRPTILDAIRQATDPTFSHRARSGNIYGDGLGAERVITALDALDWSTLSAPLQFADPDLSFVGEMMELQ